MEIKTREAKVKGVKNLLFLCILIILAIPGLQGRFNFIKEPDLGGAFKKSPPPTIDSLNPDSWFNGHFQEEYDYRVEQNIGFRNFLVKLNNQLDFTLFKKANAEGVVVGKYSMLFEEDYINEYLGNYYVGDSVWIKKALKIRLVQDTLQKLGKTILVIFEPDKASVFPENIPDLYDLKSKRTSNYERLSKELQLSGVNVLDLNKYFLTIKGKTEYPIFPQCGTHWSYYGATLAADTSIRFIENLINADLPDMKIVANNVPDVPRHPDYDIGLAMNLYFMIPHPKTADPIVEFNMQNKVRPDALVVGDSFYFNWLNNRIPTKVFSTCDFWYYNKNITHSDGTQDGVAGDLNFRDEIMNRDIILIMITGRFMHAFAWGFDEKLYDLFYPGKTDPIDHFTDQVRIYGDHFKKLYKESVQNGVSLEKRIYDEATYLFTEDIKKNPDKYTTREARIISIEIGIKNTPEWYKDIEKKAKANNIPVEEQLRLDAEWVYNDKYGKK